MVGNLSVYMKGILMSRPLKLLNTLMVTRTNICRKFTLRFFSSSFKINVSFNNMPIVGMCNNAYTYGCQQKALDPMQLELEVGVRHFLWVLGNTLQSSAESFTQIMTKPMSPTPRKISSWTELYEIFRHFKKFIFLSFTSLHLSYNSKW